jgi:PST family polysaccharide transporter
VLINGIVATPAALMQREFRAGKRLLIDQVINWLGAAVSIGAAVAGMGAMSLGLGRLVGSLAGAVLFLAWEPISFGFDREIARRLLRFGLPLAGSSMVFFSVLFVDQFVVGSVIGPVALGFYLLAFNVSNWPISVFSQPIRQVSPAAFARLQGDRPALRSAFVSSVGLLTAATLPVCLVLTGAAEPIIRTVYGAAWEPAATALGWLGLLAGLRLFFELVYDYFVVLGRTRLIFAVQLTWFVALVPSLYVGAELGGIAGAAAAQVLVALLVVLPTYLLALHRVEISCRSLAAGVAVPFACGVGVVVVTLVATRLTSLDVLALGVAALALAAALAIEAKRMRATVHSLRTVVTGSAG